MENTDRRKVIPEKFRCNNLDEMEVHYYYSYEEKLFYFRLEKENEISEDEYLVAIRTGEIKKNRIYVLSEILEAYNCDVKNIILAKKGNKIYFIPLKKD